MKQFLTYILYTALIYAAIMTVPYSTVNAVLCVVVGMMLALYDFVVSEVV